MKITYDPSEDVLVIDQGRDTDSDILVGRNCELIASYLTTDDDEGPRTVESLNIINFAHHLPLQRPGMYDAETDTRLFGDKLEPDIEYQVVENGDLVAYWKKDKRFWRLSGVALRRATYYLAKGIAQYPKLRDAKPHGRWKEECRK